MRHVSDHQKISAMREKLVAMTAKITRNASEPTFYCFVCEDSGFVLHEDEKAEGVIWSRPCRACERGRAIKAGRDLADQKRQERINKLGQQP